METMDFFTDNFDDSVHKWETTEGINEIVTSSGLETFGNNKIVVTLISLYKRGMMHSSNQGYKEYCEAVKAYGDPDRRDIIAGIMIQPVYKFITKFESTNRELEQFIMLNSDAKAYVLSLEEKRPDLDDVIALENSGIFAKVDKSVVTELLKNVEHSKLASTNWEACSLGVSVLLQCMIDYSLNSQFDEVIKYAGVFNKEQINVLRACFELGLDFEYLSSKYSDVAKLRTVLDLVKKFMEYDSSLCRPFAIKYLYDRFSEKELNGFSYNTIGAAYLWGFISNIYYSMQHDVCIVLTGLLARRQFNFGSLEIVLDGITKVLLPMDASVNVEVRTSIEQLLFGVIDLQYELTASGKLILYVTKSISYNVCVGARKTSPAVIFDHFSLDDLERAGFLDEFYDDDPYECLFDVCVVTFCREHGVLSIALNGYRQIPVENRYLLFLAVLAAIDGNQGWASILKRADLGAQFVRLLNVCVRCDDSFFAAVLRYHYAVLKEYFHVYDKALTLRSNVITIDGQDFDVLGVFKGDKSLLEKLKTIDRVELIKRLEVHL